jgi:hypothetical protein
VNQTESLRKETPEHIRRKEERKQLPRALVEHFQQTVKEHRGYELTYGSAEGYVLEWVLTLQKDWEDFLRWQFQVLDVIYGQGEDPERKPGNPPRRTTTMEIAGFKKLYELYGLNQLTDEKAASELEKLLSFIEWLYDLPRV